MIILSLLYFFNDFKLINFSISVERKEIIIINKSEENNKRENKNMLLELISLASKPFSLIRMSLYFLSFFIIHAWI